MLGFNRVFLMGRLGLEPELMQSQKGKYYTRLRIANNWRSKDGSTDTDWFSVMVWGDQAENAAKFLHKGSGVMVEAYLDNYNLETESGGTETRVGITAKRLEFLPGSKTKVGLD